jgi:hypothetical protein
MADMVWTAGEQKAFERMIDARIAIVRDRPTGRQIHATDDAGTDIQNGALVQRQYRSLAPLELHHAAVSSFNGGGVMICPLDIIPSTPDNPSSTALRYGKSVALSSQHR